MARTESLGFILHMRPYRNTSAIADVFTQDYGRVHIVAKGIKSIKSKYYSLLHQFQELRLAWYGNGDLYTLTSVEQFKTGNNIVSCLGKSNRILSSAYYCNELIMRFFSKEDPHPALYNFYRETLAKLTTIENIEVALRLFEKELLLQSGYAFDLVYDANSGDKFDSNCEYYFSPDIGASRLKTPNMNSNYKVSGKTLLALANNTLPDEETLKEAKHLMRYVISSHLGDNPLKSRKYVMHETL